MSNCYNGYMVNNNHKLGIQDDLLLEHPWEHLALLEIKTVSHLFEEFAKVNAEQDIQIPASRIPKKPATSHGQDEVLIKRYKGVLGSAAVRRTQPNKRSNFFRTSNPNNECMVNNSNIIPWDLYTSDWAEVCVTLHYCFIQPRRTEYRGVYVALAWRL